MRIKLYSEYLISNKKLCFPFRIIKSQTMKPRRKQYTLLLLDAIFNSHRCERHGRQRRRHICVRLGLIGRTLCHWFHRRIDFNRPSLSFLGSTYRHGTMIMLNCKQFFCSSLEFGFQVRQQLPPLDAAAQIIHHVFVCSSVHLDSIRGPFWNGVVRHLVGFL